jgi:hypothetical protein
MRHVKSMSKHTTDASNARVTGNDVLCFHLVMLLFQGVDFAANHLNLLDVAGDCWGLC